MGQFATAEDITGRVGDGIAVAPNGSNVCCVVTAEALANLGAPAVANPSRDSGRLCSRTSRNSGLLV